MDELVRKILNIEAKANKIVEDEKRRLLVLPKDVETVLNEKKKEIEEKSRIRMEKLIEAEEEDEARKIEELEKDYNKNLENLLQTVEKNRKKWISDIYNKIII